MDCTLHCQNIQGNETKSFQGWDEETTDKKQCEENIKERCKVGDAHCEGVENTGLSEEKEVKETHTSCCTETTLQSLLPYNSQ
jgi:hypothetical protein